MTANCVEVTAPASVANIGPGFDTFGLSLSLYNRFRYRRRADGLGLLVTGGEGLPRGAENMAVSAFMATCRRLGVECPTDLSVELDLAVPRCGGLGSSATAVVAGMLAAEALQGGSGLDRQSRLELASELEGHADNVTPCLLGGFTMSLQGRRGLTAFSFDVPKPPCLALLVPEGLRVDTGRARAALPARLAHADAARSAGFASLLAVALTTGNWQLLRTAGLEDLLHEPYRAHLVPGFEIVCRQARESGALAAVLSGSGPTILLLSETAEASRASADVARECWAERGVAVSVLQPEIDRVGARVERAS